MSRMRTIRANAPLLLRATKKALKHLLRQDPCELDLDEVKRQDVMTVLRVAIAEAEPPQFDERLTSIRLQMTSATWRNLRNVLIERASRSLEDSLVWNAVEEGLRETKQRIYVTMGINPRVLRRLAWVLKHTGSPKQDKPFKRLADQIEKEGLTKNPMEILGQMGL